MPRLLLLALAALAACDTAPLPERTNRFDPGATTADRVPTSPSRLTLTAATATSVTVEWDDRSTFEEGFAIFGAASVTNPLGTRDRIVVPANTTSLTIEGMVGSRTVRLSVRALGDGGPAVQDPALLDVRYPAGEAFFLGVGEGGVLVEGPARPVLYRERRAGGVQALGLLFGTGTVASLGDYGTLTGVAGPLASGEVVVEQRTSGLPSRRVAVVEGADTGTPVDLAAPAGAFVGRGAASPDGARYVAAYDDGTGARLASWDPRTGALRTDGAGTPSLGGVVGVRLATDGGTAVVEEAGGDLVGVRLADGARLWRRTPLAITIQMAVDGVHGRIALARAGRRIEVLDAATGATVADVALPAVSGPAFLSGDYLGVTDGGVTFVRELSSGAVLRAATSPTRVTVGGVVGDDLVLYDGRVGQGEVRRVPLDAAWEVVPDDGQ